MPLHQYATMYDHDTLGNSTVRLAVVTPGTKPVTDQWIPAYRDMIGDVCVVWIRSSLSDGDLWISDGQGERKTKRWS